MKAAQQPIEVKINSLSHDGRGLTLVNEKTTFVTGALASEVVNCKLTKKHSRYNEAEVLEVITPSPDRVTPGCEHASICGGCSLQHMSMEAQIKLKEQTLLEQLKHFGKVTPEHILPPMHAKSWHYRRKARLGVRYVRKKDKVIVGFREKFSNYLADIQSCKVLHESVGLRILELADLVRSLSVFEHIPQIEVGISDTETALIFRHLEPVTPEDKEKLCAFAEKNNLHFYLQPNAPEKIHKIWPLNTSDKLTYRLPDFDLELHFHPLDFIQINSEINKLLLNKAIELLAPQKNENVLDLFCGLGNFTFPIAKHAHSVVGVEGGQEMVDRAKENAVINHITNAEFYAANLMDEKTLSNAVWLNNQYDKILLDPPRLGAKEVILYFSKLKAKRIVYVSCNPATLARDAGELVYNLKYRLTHVGVINMFPHTSHVEAIAVFEK